MSSTKKPLKIRRHHFLVSGTKFIIDTFYTPLKQVGTGAYGVVCAALDKRTNKKIAIKKVTNAFQDLIDAKRILREMKLLRHFKHENIIAITDLINPSSKDDFEDVYLVFDFMETDMHKIIYSKNELTDEHCQYFAYQMLRGLKHIHSANVLHRDLKPSNLLLNGNCDLKICDFGLARGVGIDHSVELTEYVVTRWYRAPEIMCACQEYDCKIDVWSVGCILMELLLRKPLFPGDDYIHQLNLIFQLLGTPVADDLNWVSNEKALHYVLSLPKQAPVPFEKLFSKKPNKPNPLALDLIAKMLMFNPSKRSTVDEALAHPYLKSLNVKEDVPAPPAFNFDFEKRAGTKAGIQECMLEEIREFRPDWYRSQFHPEEFDLDVEDEKPAENVPASLAGTDKK